MIVKAAVAAGIPSWFFFNRVQVRGNHAVAACFIAQLSVFAWLYQFTGDALTSVWMAVLISASYLFGLGLCTVAYRLSPFHPLASFPGPRLWWISSLWLTYVSYRGKRHLALDDLHRRYGRFVRIAPNALSINSTSANIIYGAQHDLPKSDSYISPLRNGAVSVFFKQETSRLHHDRKRIWLAAFAGAAVVHYFPHLERRTYQLLRTLEERQSKDVNGTTDLSRLFSHWAYDVMGDVVFGGCNKLELMQSNDPLRLVEDGKDGIMIFDSFGQTPWLMDLVWILPVGKSLVRVCDVAAALMRNRVSSDQDITYPDLTSYLLRGDPSTGETISLRDLEVEAVIAIQAGSDNTSTTMSLAFYFMLSDPRYYQMLQNELDGAFQDKLGDLDATKLSQLPMLNAVLNEALRLGSPFYLPRVVSEGGITIDGFHIPEGAIVALAAYSQQIGVDNYSPDPMKFYPERWLPDALEYGCHTERSALFSFSSGPHVCVAKAFAYQEMRLVVARVMLAYNMELAPGFDVQAYREGILNMRTTFLQQPLMVKATRRTIMRADGPLTGAY